MNRFTTEYGHEGIAYEGNSLVWAVMTAISLNDQGYAHIRVTDHDRIDIDDHGVGNDGSVDWENYNRENPLQFALDIETFYR